MSVFVANPFSRNPDTSTSFQDIRLPKYVSKYTGVSLGFALPNRRKALCQSTKRNVSAFSHNLGEKCFAFNVNPKVSK